MANIDKYAKIHKEHKQLQKEHEEKLIALYNKYYELALGGDVQAFRAFTDFSKIFMGDDSEENELMSILKGAKVGD